MKDDTRYLNMNLNKTKLFFQINFAILEGLKNIIFFKRKIPKKSGGRDGHEGRDE